MYFVIYGYLKVAINFGIVTKFWKSASAELRKRAFYQMSKAIHQEQVSMRTFRQLVV